MLIRLYRKLKSAMDRDRMLRDTGRSSTLAFWIRRAAFRLVIQIIVFPRWLLLGPFRTFTQFARRDEGGAWIDSYDEFIVSNRVTLRGVVLLMLVALLAVVVFIYLPVIYI